MSNKEAFSVKEYLDACKRRLTTSPSIVCLELGVSRRAVYRFIERHPKSKEQAEAIIAEIGEKEFGIKFDTFENFQKIPSIIKWVRMYRRKPKMVAESKILTRQRELWHMCKYLKTHPMKVTPEQVAEIIVAQRDKTYRRKVLKDKGQPIPDELKVIRGLGYYGQREAWRSYFQMIKGISGLILSDMGIDAQASFGYGEQSKERLTQAQREAFGKSILEVCKNPKYQLTNNHYVEGLAAAKFMYYTGTRRTACVDINFEHCRFELTPDMWMIEVIDKGQRGGIKWEKILIGHSLNDLKSYISERFGIDSEFETRVPKEIKALFPSYFNREEFMTTIFRRVHDLAGIKTTIPCHIFRHTFAQDCLDATDWNYEMVATLGGWKNTKILKDAYGEMGRSPKIRGLRAAMGLPVVKVETELKW